MFKLPLSKLLGWDKDEEEIKPVDLSFLKEDKENVNSTYVKKEKEVSEKKKDNEQTTSDIVVTKSSNLIIIAGETEELKSEPQTYYGRSYGYGGNWKGTKWNNNSAKKSGLTERQKKYVLKNHETKTSHQMTKHLSCSYTELWDFLREEKITCKPPGDVKKICLDEDDDTVVITDQEVEEIEKKKSECPKMTHDLNWKENFDRVLLAIWTMEEEHENWLDGELKHINAEERGEIVPITSIAGALREIRKDRASRSLCNGPPKTHHRYYFEANGDVIYRSGSIYKESKEKPKMLGFKSFDWEKK